MAMLSEVVDGVIGADTHRDTNQLEIAFPSGAVIATGSFSNDSIGHAKALAWIFQQAPGPRRVLSIEGTRSYGVGLARAAAVAAIPVIEAEQPSRKAAEARANPTQWTHTWQYCLRWASTPTNSPSHAPTATAKPCASCCARGRS